MSIEGEKLVRNGQLVEITIIYSSSQICLYGNNIFVAIGNFAGSKLDNSADILEGER
jgi:hypothetical protein